MSRSDKVRRLLIDFRSRYAIEQRAPKQEAAPARPPESVTVHSSEDLITAVNNAPRGSSITFDEAGASYPPVPDSTANLLVALLPLLAGAAVGSALIGRFPRAFGYHRRRRR